MFKLDYCIFCFYYVLLFWIEFLPAWQGRCAFELSYHHLVFSCHWTNCTTVIYYFDIPWFVLHFISFCVLMLAIFIYQISLGCQKRRKEGFFKKRRGDKKENEQIALSPHCIISCYDSNPTISIMIRMIKWTCKCSNVISLLDEISELNTDTSVDLIE